MANDVPKLKVSGIGVGGGLRCTDPEALSGWYQEHLGVMAVSERGAWEQQAEPTVFAPFPARATSRRWRWLSKRSTTPHRPTRCSCRISKLRRLMANPGPLGD